MTWPRKGVKSRPSTRPSIDHASMISGSLRGAPTFGQIMVPRVIDFCDIILNDEHDASYSNGVRSEGLQAVSADVKQSRRRLTDLPTARPSQTSVSVSRSRR